jgi:hypothetical protein
MAELLEDVIGAHALRHLRKLRPTASIFLSLFLFFVIRTGTKGSKRTGTNGFWGPAAQRAVGPRASVPVHIATGTNALEY